MNDRQDPYGQIYGYDEYGRPLYGDQPQQQSAYDYGQYFSGYAPEAASGGPSGGQGVRQEYPYDYGTGQVPVDGAYDYGTGVQAPVHGGGTYGTGYGTDQAGQGYGTGYDTGQGYDTGRQSPDYGGVPPGQGYGSSPGYDPGTGPQPAARPGAAPQPPQGVPRQRRPGEESYDTEQFSFVEEEDEESEDVIDWLKFSESRSERREEARRRLRNRLRLLALTLVLAMVAGAGYLWTTDRLPAIPGLSGTEGSSVPGGEAREVIAVHLRETGGDATATVLLVANRTAEEGTALLLPNALSVTADRGGATTLGQAVDEEGAASVRDALGALLGAGIEGTWRLDTPYLEILVDLLGGISVDTDIRVPGSKGDDGPLVPRGKDTDLTGRAAVAYATHRGADEPQTAQLERFGQVMQAVLAKMPSREEGAIETVRALTQIADPSLPEEELGASLAELAGYARDDALATTLLPVSEDGTISDETADGMVADVLGGSVTNAEPGDNPRIGIRDAGSTEDAGETARIALINGGFSVADSRPASEARETSEITYSAEAHRETALRAARTLGLPEDVVTQGDGPGSAEVTVVLGEDYQPDGGGPETE